MEPGQSGAGAHLVWIIVVVVVAALATVGWSDHRCKRIDGSSTRIDQRKVRAGLRNIKAEGNQIRGGTGRLDDRHYPATLRARQRPARRADSPRNAHRPPDRQVEGPLR